MFRVAGMRERVDRHGHCETAARAAAVIAEGMRHVRADRREPMTADG